VRSTVASRASPLLSAISLDRPADFAKEWKMSSITFDLLTLVFESLIPIKSSNINSVFYLPDTLFIRFHGGQVYMYEGVPASIYAGLLAAQSKGGYFVRYIERVYPGEKIS
jgi:KTSC domain-containing protein